MRVCRAGAGFYVTAAVAATLALQCDCCPRVFQHPVSGEFQVLAGRNIRRRSATNNSIILLFCHLCFCYNLNDNSLL